MLSLCLGVCGAAWALGQTTPATAAERSRAPAEAAPSPGAGLPLPESESERVDPDRAPPPTPEDVRSDGLTLPVEEEEVKTLPAPPPPPEPPQEPEPSAERDASLPPSDRFVLWRDDALGAWIKPVVQLATGLVTWAPSRRRSRLTPQLGTLLWGQLGFEGQIVPSVGFRVGIERSVGFTYDVSGVGGTSVWEGGGEFRPRETYIRLRRWGITVQGGIVLDLDTVDFTSAHTEDFFNQDPFIRQPLIASGLSEGAGLVFKYELFGIRLGFSYTAGRPIVTSVAGAFGGVQRLLPEEVDAPFDPLGAIPVPGDDVHMQVFTPSLAYDHEFFDIRAAGQITLFDTDLTAPQAPVLFGYNLRATTRLKLFDEMLVLFGGFAYRQNEQPVADLAKAEGFVGSVGLDFNLRDVFGAGVSFTHVEQLPLPEVMVRFRTVNVGATYWIAPELAAVGLRYSRVMPGKRGVTVQLLTADSLILSLRVMI